MTNHKYVVWIIYLKLLVVKNMNCKNLTITIMWVVFIFALMLNFICGVNLFLLSILLWFVLIGTMFLNFGAPSDYQ
jgi:hypothetical protein